MHGRVENFFVKTLEIRPFRGYFLIVKKLEIRRFKYSIFIIFYRGYFLIVMHMMMVHKIMWKG